MADTTDEAIPAEVDARWQVALKELEASFRQVEAELGLLTEIDRCILRNEPIETVVDLVTERVRSVLEVDAAALEHLGAGQLSVAALDVKTADTAWPGEDTRGAIHAIKDLRTGARSETETTQPAGLIISVPIRPKEHTIACLSVWSQHPEALNGSDRRFLKSVARQLSIAYDKAHVLESNELLADLDALFFGNASERDTVHQLLSAIADHFTSLPDHQGDRLQVLFPTPDERLEIVYSSNPDDVGLVVDMTSVSGVALRENRTIVIDDVRDEERYLAFLGDDVRSECAVPIRLGENSVAVFNVESDREAAYSGYAAYFIEQYVRQLRFLLAFARLREDITDQIEITSADEVFVMMAGAAADLLHQVNNKLSALKTRLTQVGETTGEEQAALIERCKGLADDALAAPEAMKERLSEVAAPDINSVILRVAGSIGADFEEIRVITDDLAPNLLPVRTFLLHEVLENVMRNAANAVTTNPRTDTPPAITVTSSVRRKASAVPMIDIEIIDNGPGMTPEQQAQLFEIRSSSRAESSRRSPAGWGFGMYFVDKAVRRVGGEVLVVSDPGVGTRVRLTFPVTRSHDAAAGRQDPPDIPRGEP